MVLIVTFLGNSKRVLKQNSNRGRANNTSLHRTSKASAFFVNWQIIGLKTLSFKRNSFFAFAACELNRYLPLVHLLTKHEKIRIKMYHFVNINVWGIKAKKRSDLDNPN